MALGGDYVIAHDGFALSKLDIHAKKTTFALFAEMAAATHPGLHSRGAYPFSNHASRSFSRTTSPTTISVGALS